MAKKTSKTAKSNELDGKEFFAAIALIGKGDPQKLYAGKDHPGPGLRL